MPLIGSTNISFFEPKLNLVRFICQFKSDCLNGSSVKKTRAAQRGNRKLVRIKTPLLWVLPLLFSTLALAGGGTSTKPVLPPMDESRQSPDLVKFLERLREAVEERNTPIVHAALHEDVRLGFGPDESGAGAAASALADKNSQLWQALESSISSGGTFTSKGDRITFCMPYTFSAFPDHLDPGKHRVIVKPSVTAHTEPSSSGKTIPLPDYAIVRADLGATTTTRSTNRQQWARIYLNGKPAYVPADTTRSPLASRTCLEKRGEDWRISAIITGD